MSATKNECNQGSPSIYRPEANAWISKRSSDLDYKGVFALIKIGFLQSSFYEVMWSSLPRRTRTAAEDLHEQVLIVHANPLQQTIHMKIPRLFFEKRIKLSSAAVVIGDLRVSDWW